MKIKSIHRMGDIEEEQKIALKTYPYTYARVSAMRGKLIKKQDYIRLLKMDTTSIIRYLQETEYKKSVDRLASAHRGVNLAEYAINDNLVETVNKLKAISEKEVVELVDAYLRRWDILNLKTVLRIKNKVQKLQDNSAENLLVPLGSLDKKFLINLLNMNSVIDVLKKVKSLGYNINVEEFEKNKDLAVIENQLDKDFFYKTLEFVGSIPEEGERFKVFLKIEIDVINIRNLLKLKRVNADKSRTIQFLIFSGQYIGKSELERLAETRNIEELMDKLKSTKYGKVFGSSQSIVDIELELDRFWLQSAALYSHQNPLSVQTILAYLLAKDIEARNLKAIVRGKQLGITEDFIEKKLLI